MDKNELLMSIGFSKEYISYLEQLDEKGLSCIEPVPQEYRYLATDVTNVIITEPSISHMTQVLVQRK